MLVLIPFFGLNVAKVLYLQLLEEEHVVDAWYCTNQSCLWRKMISVLELQNVYSVDGGTHQGLEAIVYVAGVCEGFRPMTTQASVPGGLPYETGN